MWRITICLAGLMAWASPASLLAAPGGGSHGGGGHGGGHGGGSMGGHFGSSMGGHSGFSASGAHQGGSMSSAGRVSGGSSALHGGGVPHGNPTLSNHSSFGSSQFHHHPSQFPSDGTWSGSHHGSTLSHYDHGWWQHGGHDHHGDWHNHGWGWWGGPWWGGWGLAFEFGPYYYGPGLVYLYPDCPGYEYMAAYSPAEAVPAPEPTVAQQPVQAPIDPTVGDPSAGDPPAGIAGSQYYQDALSAFAQGNYREAVRLAAHASIDWPKDPKPHQLAALGLFAAGNYRGAAMEAHAAAALGPVIEWSTVAGYYGNDVKKYTEQLRALEGYVDGHKTDPATRFLLGYHYLIADFRDDARAQLAEVVKAVPQDKLAGQLLVRAGGKLPAAPPPTPAPSK